VRISAFTAAFDRSSSGLSGGVSGPSFSNISSFCGVTLVLAGRATMFNQYGSVLCISCESSMEALWNERTSLCSPYHVVRPQLFSLGLADPSTFFVSRHNEFHRWTTAA
jgi:hypothetical protein